MDVQVAQVSQPPITTTTPQGRLTLARGIAIPASDIAGAITLYWTPLGGGLTIWNGTGWSVVSLSSDLSTNLDSVSSGSNFDVFAFLAGSSPALGIGPTWTSDTIRSAAVVPLNGLLVNATPITITYGSGSTTTLPANQGTLLGSIRGTGAGMTEDSSLRRFVSNAYNAVPRRLMRAEALGSNWSYTTATWRQVNANSANQVEVLNTLDGLPTRIRAAGMAISSDSGAQPLRTGIGFDSTGIDSSTLNPNSYAPAYSGTPSTLVPTPTWAEFEGYAGIGHHVFPWLEFGGGSNMTWYASFGGAGLGSSSPSWTTGLSGEVWA